MVRNLPGILIRVMVGLVFMTEGLLKFLLPGELGAGRFEHLGLPLPHLLAPAVGVVEVLGGAAVLFNLYAGDAALLLLAVMVGALLTTKLPILLGHQIWRFEAPKLNHYGVLSFLHEARTDLCMVIGCLAVLAESGLKLFKKTKWYAR